MKDAIEIEKISYERMNQDCDYYLFKSTKYFTILKDLDFSSPPSHPTNSNTIIKV